VIANSRKVLGAEGCMTTSGRAEILLWERNENILPSGTDKNG